MYLHQFRILNLESRYHISDIKLNEDEILIDNVVCSIYIM